MRRSRMMPATCPTATAVTVTTRNPHPDLASFNSSTQSYKVVPENENSLKANRGYWVYANKSGNLTFPSSGGSAINATYNWADLMFWNGSEYRSMQEADQVGWISGEIKYYDSEIWADAQRYAELGADSPNILYTWKGYWIESYFSNITLVRQD